MTRIGNNIKELYKELSDQTQLIVVSKYREIDEIKEVYLADGRFDQYEQSIFKMLKKKMKAK